MSSFCLYKLTTTGNSRGGIVETPRDSPVGVDFDFLLHSQKSSQWTWDNSSYLNRLPEVPQCPPPGFSRGNRIASEKASWLSWLTMPLAECVHPPSHPQQQHLPYLTDSKRKPGKKISYSRSGRSSVEWQGQDQTKILSFPIQCFLYCFTLRPGMGGGVSKVDQHPGPFYLFSWHPFPQSVLKGQ